MARKKRPNAKAPSPSAPEEDAALWKAFARNIDPLELKGRVPDTDSSLLDEMLRRGSSVSDASVTPQSRPAVPQSPKPSSPVRTKAANTPAPGHIDTRQVRRMGRGQDTVDARIDLHGMRQSEAHSALRVFLFRSVAKGHRMVLVITGKGKPQTSRDDGGKFGAFIHEGAYDRGVLRRNVPLWLAEPDVRQIIVGHTTAHIRHGGEGALYVQLRRKR